VPVDTCSVALRLGERAATIRYPVSIQELIVALFGSVPEAESEPDIAISVEEIADGLYAVDPGVDSIIGDGTFTDLSYHLSDRTISKLVDGMKDAVAVHAGAVQWKDQCIIVPGSSMAGKTSVVAWLLNRGCRYITDEITLVSGDGTAIDGFPRALAFKTDGGDLIKQLPNLDPAQRFDAGSRAFVRPRREAIAAGGGHRCGLIIFPHYVAGASSLITPLTPGQAAFRLMAGNVNARNFEDGGLAAVTALTRRAPAFVLQYGDFEQLDGTLDTLAELVLERGVDADRIRSFLLACGSPSRFLQQKRRDRQPATPRRAEPKKLTIGMPTYDDYDGVYFSLQALRMYHAEVMDQVELVVVDNHPDGPCSEGLKKLEGYIPNYRYVPVSDRQGTVVKGVVFSEAAGEYVLCIDCHVMIVPGGIKVLLDYFGAHPDSRDLVQGPLLGDELSLIATHMEPKWSGGMFGVWKHSPISELPNEPITIELHGMGLFASRREAWVGFNPAFRGWGIEEGYIHEKFRRAGGKVVCLPDLQWIHRFHRPMGWHYHHSWEERVRNYAIAWRELGKPLTDMEAHFREVLGKDYADDLINAVKEELAEA
jgi:glycosyl transferase family 2